MFDFASLDGQLGGYVRLELLPNQDTCWYWAWVVGPDRPPVVVLDQEVPLPRGAGLELRTTGLWADHIVEEPFEHVSVGAEAFALLLDDPAEALGPLVGMPTPFGLDLGWETAGARTSTAGTTEGYGLPCHVVGEVLVADERIELDGIGHRWHTWGVEDWWSAGWRSVAGRLDDGTWFADRTEVGANDRALEPHDATFPTSDRARLEEQGLDLVIEPLAFAPVPVANDDGRACRLVRALCRYRDPSSEHCGVGWTEWNQPL